MCGSCISSNIFIGRAYYFWINMLDQIGIEYNTDKSSKIHDYLNIYERYFEELKHKEIRLLEIGIQSGRSLRMWKKYFNKAEIYGMDIEKVDMNEEKIFTIQADQENRENMFSKMVNGQFDIIIDDGGHTMGQQQVSLGFMFKYLKPRGIYVIEDLHTSYVKQYNKTNTIKTTIYMLNKFINEKIIDSDFITESENKFLLDNISECIIEKGKESEICFIRRGE